jgi:flagellar protein FlaF
METGLPALVIAAILMLASVFIARSGFVGADRIGQSLRQSEARFGQQNRTGLSVNQTSIDASGANITVTIENEGQTALADWAAMDVLVQYFDEDGTRYDKWIAYTDGALASDTWTTGSFTDDVFEPGILNSGEQMEIDIRINPVAGPGTTNRVIVVTERGVGVDASFAGPP